jgi:O-antigen biosynthesis protein
MNYLRERTRRQFGYLREAGNQLTGGGLRSLVKRVLTHLRSAGDRITGGGLRSLSKQVFVAGLRRAMRQSVLKALGGTLLKPFPNVSARLYDIATKGDAATGAATSERLPGGTDYSLLVKSLYKTAFGRMPDPGTLVDCIRQLRSGVPISVMAEDFASSDEFRMRYGASHGVDIPYITALYRSGLGRIPGLNDLAVWLREGENGATRAKILAGVAGSDEALEEGLSPAPKGGTDYGRWIRTFDTICPTDRAVIRAHISALPYRPFVSLILLIGEKSDVALRKSIDSVLAQLYPYWELCVVVDSAREPHFATIVHEFKTREVRIRVAEQDNGEEPVTSNAALALASGEFFGFIRTGDILPEHALYEVAFELGKNRGADVVYTDHDHIDVSGQRFDPWFKPSWDPDLLLAYDYISSFFVCRKSVAEAVGFLRPGFEGAELYDLALRVTTATAPERISHIPAILYHRRSEDRRSEDSTVNPNNSTSALDAIPASHRAVRDHLNSTGCPEAVLIPASQMPKAIRVEWPMPKQPPLVSTIILTRDRADLLGRCLEGVLHRTDYLDLEVLIVDNGSVEPATLALFDRLTREENRVRILHHPGQFNYSALNNAAAREAQGEVLLLLNNDIDVIGSGWLREMVSHAIRPDIGVVGAKLIYGNELLQHGGVVLGPDDAVHLHRFADRNDPGYRGQLALPRSLAAVTGACAAIRRAVYFEVGGLDEANLAVTYNDVDLCLRVGDHGYRVVWTPFAELFHLESVSRGLIEDSPVKRERALRELDYLRKNWGAFAESVDPLQNPNLLFASDHSEIPSVSRREKPWRSVFEQYYYLKGHFSQ